MMILYTKHLCPQCMYVKSELQELGVKLEIVNISENTKAKERLIKEGLTTAPVLQVHNTFIYDVREILDYFSEEKKAE